ncbi:MAG TPA: helix-turn-helix domain-containing protein [Lachnospiraceae bacterium]|nr:helix-turn-helix domain-containing protein [Lachnospiraceae bacterium]
MNWPKVNLSVECYVNTIRNYRYHWHEDYHEISIILYGRAEYTRGNEHFILYPDDVILIGPGIGHASLSLSQDTCALVVHLSKNTFDAFLDLGTQICFFSVTDKESRGKPLWKEFRQYASRLIASLCGNEKTDKIKARAAHELLTALMIEQLPYSIFPSNIEDPERRNAIRRVCDYMEKQYSEKITLSGLAGLIQYNRTYLSTLFHKTVGISLYDYLTRIRFQNAVYDMENTNKTLTEIAIGNGFPDLKNFSRRFRELTNMSPAEYRKSIAEDTLPHLINTRSTIAADNPVISRRLLEYRNL